MCLRAHAFEESPDAGERAAAAHTHHDRLHIVLHLLPDFGRCGGFVRQRIGGIGELVGVERAGFVGDALRHVLVVFGMALAHVGAGDAHVHAHRTQMLNFLARHLVRHDQDELVTLQRADLRQPEASVAGGGFYDGAAGLEAAVLLRRLDHRLADAVLDGAAGVLAFEFHEQPARASVEMCELDHRRVADEVEDRGDSHAGTAVRGKLSNRRPRPG